MASYPPPPPGGPPPQPQYQQPPYGQPPAKKSNVLLWVLVGVGGFLFLIVLCVLGLGLFIAHKAKQAGLDPDLIKRNPTMAAAKMMVAANPDLEIVSMNDRTQEITFHDKKNGKTYTTNFADIKNGKFSMKENGQETLSITSSGDKGQVEMKSADGTVKIGGDAKVPTWLPDYPGSQPQGAFTAQGKDGNAGTFTFKTNDSSDKVVKYYQDQLKASGMKVSSNITSQDGASSAAVLTVQDDATKHSATIIIGGEHGETSVAVTYQTK